MVAEIEFLGLPLRGRRIGQSRQNVDQPPKLPRLRGLPFACVLRRENEVVVDEVVDPPHNPAGDDSQSNQKDQSVDQRRVLGEGREKLGNLNDEE